MNRLKGREILRILWKNGIVEIMKERDEKYKAYELVYRCDVGIQ